MDDPPPLQDEEASANAGNRIGIIGNEDDKIASHGDGDDTCPSSPSPALSPVIVIKGLSILPPRQKTTMQEKGRCEEGDRDGLWGGGVALPPLRPEEPVASLRGALGEVLGFAHLTRYRLVVERIKGGSRNAQTMETKNQQKNQERQLSSRVVGKKQSSSHYPRHLPHQDDCWSPFTLRDAVVTVPPSLRSLENCNGGSPGDSVGEEKGKEEVEEEDELALDEYGDLSLLLPMLTGDAGRANSSTASSTHGRVDKEKKADEGAVEGIGAIATDEEEEQEETIILDAEEANIALRVVLERYDLASIRDQVTKVRNLLGGNVPYITSLAGGGGVEEEKNQDSSAAEDAVAADDNGLVGTDGAVNDPLSFLLECDALFETALGGCDLTNFYYLACGEEKTLHRLLNERKNMDGLGVIQDENGNKKIVNSGIGSGGRNRKKSKNDKSNPSHENPTNGLDTGKRSIEEIERELHSLNEATRVHATVRMSGYHPPPSHRRVLGDLAYLEATCPDGTILHLTAFSRGFYVNRSTMTRFDPTPAVKKGGKNGSGGGVDGSNTSCLGGDDACYSHALLDCLLQSSTSLRSAWRSALVASKERSDLLVKILSPTPTSPSGANVDDFVHYNNLFRNAASSYPNNASGPAATATGAAGLPTNSGSPMPATRPSTFLPRLDSLTVRPQWLVPLPSVKIGDMVGPRLSTRNHGNLHSYDASRAEDELTSHYGMDIRGGGLRDWNEELQTAREMSVETFVQRIERARLVQKVLSDFGDAALQGVKAILDGYILPMNPNEQARSHVYLHNNIFFSRAIDTGLDTFKVTQGDAAAKKSASRDAQNMGVLHRLDVPGLHSLATVLVEYLGMRMVCQSIVPGILHGEKSHTLLYGAVETLSELQFDDEMHKLLEACIGEGCMVATRTIPVHPLNDERMDAIRKCRITPLLEPGDKVNEDKINATDKRMDKAVKVCGPVEMKGILGSDNRKYVLDCTRLTPRDANWVSESSGGTGRWESAKLETLVPTSLDDDEWTVCVLRPELVANYAESKISELISNSSREGVTTKGETSEEDKKEEPVADASPSTTKAHGNKEEGGNVPEEEENTIAEQKNLLEKVERSLRFNVNVFLPFTRSVTGIDNETLKQDEEEARQIARHLWDVVIPNLNIDIRAGSVSGLQIPVDGRSLTELIHQRGINCRYLGRLATLARIEELEDINSFEKAAAAAASNANDELSIIPPRLRMPICWLELLECEMVARAAKHVLDSYMIEESSAQPARMIASFLSAIISVGEESAGETEHRQAHSGSKVIPDQDEMNALTLCFDVCDEVNGYSTASPLFKGRGEIWSDIEREIGRRYRYTLSLFNTKNSAKRGATSRAIYIPLLRRICQRSGIRLVSRKYDVGKNCVTGPTVTYPIAPTDVLEILPLVKHAASVSGESFAPCSFNSAAGSSLHVLLPDAKTRYEVAHESYFTNRNATVALNYAQEASAMYQQVLDSPLHPHISKCFRLIAIAHFHKDERELAISAAMKYLTVTTSLNGFDSAEALNAHLTLADILIESRKSEALTHIRAAYFLMEFMAGKDYSGISSQYYRMGSHYFDLGNLEGALHCFKVAALKRSEDRMFECHIARNTARILARLGKFKQSFDYEKKAYQLYAIYLGDEHEATKACSATLVRLMKLAVEQGKFSKIQEKERLDGNAADAVADEIRASEEAEEAKPIKKKKQHKKKGKK